MNKIFISMLIGLLTAYPLSAYSYDYDGYAVNSYPDYEITQPADDFEAMAEVIHAEPIYETVSINRPVTECWIERRGVPVSRPDHRLVSGVIGGILGGVAGHQVGGGRGRDAATVAGSILGTAIGYNLGSRRANHQEPAYYDQKLCETVDRPVAEERVSGYRVEYRYQGQVFVTHTDQHPGQWIRLKVNVTPT